MEMKKLITYFLTVCVLSLSMQIAVANAADSAIEPLTAQTHKEFKVSKDNKIIGGVCGGLGEYFNIDPNKIRWGFVLFSLLGGSGLLVYAILWIVMY